MIAAINNNGKITNTKTLSESANTLESRLGVNNVSPKRNPKPKDKNNAGNSKIP